jgi:hypothetical protein
MGRMERPPHMDRPSSVTGTERLIARPTDIMGCEAALTIQYARARTKLRNRTVGERFVRLESEK